MAEQPCADPGDQRRLQHPDFERILVPFIGDEYRRRHGLPAVVRKVEKRITIDSRLHERQVYPVRLVYEACVNRAAADDHEFVGIACRRDGSVR